MDTHTHNAANEITALAAEVGTAWATPSQDRSGNAISIPQPSNPTQSYTLVWDAWNRLVSVQDGAVTVESYAYDGLNRRIRATGLTTRDFYYNGDWHVLAEQGAVEYEYVWSPRYLDAPILRLNTTGPTEETLYYLGDANFNVTAIINSSGTVLERYVYTPYGERTIHNADWSQTRASSLYDTTYSFTGRRLDPATGLYHFRMRQYDPGLGQFLSRDPIGYAGGDVNLMRYVVSRSLGVQDPFGLAPSFPSRDSSLVPQVQQRSQPCWAIATHIIETAIMARHRARLYFDRAVRRIAQCEINRSLPAGTALQRPDVALVRGATGSLQCRGNAWIYELKERGGNNFGRGKPAGQQASARTALHAALPNHKVNFGNCNRGGVNNSAPIPISGCGDLTWKCKPAGVIEWDFSGRRDPAKRPLTIDSRRLLRDYTTIREEPGVRQTPLDDRVLQPLKTVRYVQPWWNSPWFKKLLLRVGVSLPLIN